MAGELFFVNKTPLSETLSRSKRAEKSRILSHVQNNRRRHEAKTAHENTRQPGPSVMIVIDPPAKPTKDGDPRNQKEQSPVLQLPAKYPTHNASDPFYSTVASTDAGGHHLLQCTFHSAGRFNFLAESFAPSAVCVQRTNTRHDAVFEQRMRACVWDSTLMYATLAYGSNFLGWSMGGMSEEGPPAEYYLGKALQEVRIRLAAYDSTRTIDPWVAFSISSLAVTEMWNGVPEMWGQKPGKQRAVLMTGRFGLAASRVHLNALLEFVTKAGGWDSFPPYLLDSAILADKYLSLYEVQPPVIPLSWDPGPFPGETDEAYFPLMGTGFLHVPISPELQCILQDIFSYCRVAHGAWMRPEMVDSDMEMWLFRRLQALIYRLMIAYNGLDPVSPVDRCIGLAALAFLFGCTSQRGQSGPQLGAKLVAQRIRVLLTKMATSEAVGLEGGARLWCLCMSAMISGHFPAREWFIERVKELCGGGINEASLQAALEQYLFLPSKQGGQLSYVVKRVTDGT